MIYTIIGTVPQPHSNPATPYYSHHETTRPRASHPIGEADHKITVKTNDKNTAVVLVGVFKKVFVSVVADCCEVYTPTINGATL